MKKKIYLIHKWIGIVSFAAIFAWSLTGFLHPILSWTQPRPVQPFYKPQPIEIEKLGVTLNEALEKQRVKNFGGFNIVQFNGQSYYQILPESTDFSASAGSAANSCHIGSVSASVSSQPPIYLNTTTGEKLAGGDELYAEHLARFFAAEKNAPVARIRQISEFDLEYKANNRILPVYEVSFDRADGMSAYVDTTSSKLGTLNDTRKSWLQWAFVNFHNLEFAGMPNLTRQITITLLMSLVFLTAFSGLVVYGVFRKFLGKNKIETSRTLARKYHRTIGLVVSIFALAWSGSGMFHLWAKADMAEDAKTAYTSSFKADNLQVSLNQILSGRPSVVGASVAGFNNQMYYRLVSADRNISYLNTQTGEELPNGDLEYAKFLAQNFSDLKNPVDAVPITTFTDEYGFLSKRLPVVKVQFNENSNERIYVDTGESKLALRVKDGIKQVEGFSFSYLHKGRWLDWAGRVVRDILLMAMALGNSIVAALGIWLFVGLKQRKSIMK